MLKRFAAMAVVLVLAIGATGCSIAYTSNYTTDDMEYWELGLIGFPAEEDGQETPGLLPLYRGSRSISAKKLVN